MGGPIERGEAPDGHDPFGYAVNWPLIGRERELDQLTRALADPGCAGVALVGPPGVGKTRLARHATEIAGERGFPTIFVRASRSARAVPLAALAPLLNALEVRPDETPDNVQAVLRAIERRTGGVRRLVVFVDDAQELDEASAAVLDQVLGLNGTFTIVTVRSGDHRIDTVLDLWRDEHVRRVQIGPVADDDIRRLVSVVLGDPVDGAALQALVSASGGNVLFLRELLLGALESGALAMRRGLYRLRGSLVGSPRLKDLIDHRLSGLSEGEREAVELVALGEPLELSLLADLVPDHVVEHLERRALLDAAAGPLGPEVRLAHPLYGDVVRNHLSPVRRRRLCRTLAEAAGRAGALRPSDVLRVGVWHLNGGGGSPDLLVSAARAAFRSEDHALAARLARAAWQAGHQVEAALLLTDAVDDRESAEEIEKVLAEAVKEAANDEERTAIATRRASTLFVWLDRGDEAQLILEQAAAGVSDAGHRRAIDAQRADTFVLGGDVARAIEIGAPLLSSPGDAAFAQASRDIGVAYALNGRTADAIAHTEAALRTVRDLRDTDAVTAAAVFVVARALALCEAGRLAEGAELAHAGYATVLEHRNVDGQAWFASVLGFVKVTQGLLVEAEHLYRECAAAFHDLGHPGRRWGLGGMALAAGQRGDRATATAAVAELDEVAPSGIRLMDVHVERGRAWAAAASGDLALARTILWQAVDLAEEWGQHTSSVAALHDLVRLGDVPAASRRMRQLKGKVDGDLVLARSAYAAAAASSSSKAAADATAKFEACGALLFAAESATLERRLAIAAGQSRLAVAAEVRVARLLDACEDAHTIALDISEESDRLSTREREVALLAAEGLANKEIAERLFVSTRTVENHLQRAYVKLGVTSRNDLATVLRRS